MKIMFKPVIAILAFMLFHSVALAAESTQEQDRAVLLIQALGCRGCHTIQNDGGSLAPDLTQIGSRMTASQIRAFLINHTTTERGFMPSYSSLSETELQLISEYLYQLH